jgi:hypothetical protein
MFKFRIKLDLAAIHGGARRFQLEGIVLPSSQCRHIQVVRLEAQQAGRDPANNNIV